LNILPRLDVIKVSQVNSDVKLEPISSVSEIVS